MTRSAPEDLRLDDVRGFVFDLDGTLVGRDQAQRPIPLPGAREALAAIRASGRPFALFTDSTQQAPCTIASELRQVGLDVEGDQVLTPDCSCVSYLRRRHTGQHVLVVASGGTGARMAAAGIELLQPDDPPDLADVVFVGHVDDVSLLVLERAARAVVAGARLLAANYVPAYEGADGPIINRGAMATAAIAKAAEARPVVVGKPSAAAVRAVADRLGLPSNELAVIGDDLRMDVGLGLTGGSRTIFVRHDARIALTLSRLPGNRRPDATIESIAELVPAL